MLELHVILKLPASVKVLSDVIQISVGIKEALDDSQQN